ncbi:TPA: preprotein translocase subunit SecY [bacterium]|nr:preprotein translocase subunit SecY [bacterium]
MLQSLANPFKIQELRGRILFTLALLAVYRIGVFIPTPGVDQIVLFSWFERMRGTMFELLDLFTGGAFSNLSIFALGIMPYISASIIMQLLTMVIPHLERLSKEGEAGRRKITRYTRYLTIGISIVQSLGLAFGMQNQEIAEGVRIVPQEVAGTGFILMTVLTMTTGTAFIMWLGEQITERGIGNGCSLIIFVGIVARLPTAIGNTIKKLIVGDLGIFSLLGVLIIILLTIIVVITMLQGHRRIPITHAKRVVGRKVYGGVSTHIPLQINQAGVIPVIFASALLAFPITIMQFLGERAALFEGFAQDFVRGGVVYSSLYAVLILYFTYFYTTIVFKPNDVAENLRKYGGFIPGIRPGRATAEFIEKILSRITLVGALFLVVISLLPTILTSSFGVPFYFGGTALLIVVGVALDTMKQIESHLLMHHYEGFIKRGRLKGRGR